MQTKITLGYLGFLPFAALTILPWILGETYEEISFQLLVAVSYTHLRAHET